MLKELQEFRGVISMEAAAIDSAQLAASKLPTFLDKAAEYLTKSLTQFLGDFANVKSLSWMALNAQRRPYSELRSLQVPVATGYTGSFVEYGQFLIKTVEELEDLERDVLQPFSTWISQRIDDPDSLKSLTNSLKIPGLRTPKVQGLQKRLDDFFPDKADHSTCLYSDVIKRQGDWVEINNQIKTLNTLYSNGKYEKVQKCLPDLSHLLTVLGQRIAEQRDVESFQVSSVTIEQLSKITLEIAEHIEFYGVLRHRVDEYIRMIGDNVDVVKEKF